MRSYFKIVLTNVLHCVTLYYMKKETFVSLRISDEDKRLLEKDAMAEERTISNLLLWSWKQWRSFKKKR